MDTFNTADLRGLLKDESRPCVSIYLPTQAAAPDHHQNPVRLKNLLRQAEAGLADGEEDAVELLRPAWDLLDNEAFWKGRGAGLALFASPSQFRAFRLPVALPEQTEVNEHFVLRPLFPLLTANARCLVLALSRKRVRLFEATQFEMQDITPVTMPKDLKSALNTDQVDRGSQTHTAMTGARGKQSAVFHGQGGQVDTIKDETSQFFRLVDAALQRAGNERGLPLILAGVEADLAQFRGLTRYAPVADEQIGGNVDHLADHELHRLARPVVTAISARRQQAAVARLAELDRARVSESLREILPAARQGRVETLFVPKADRQWGAFFPDSGLVQMHGTREPGDDDLLEVAALETADHGGTVFTVEPHELPGLASVAAIYRY